MSNPLGGIVIDFPIFFSLAKTRTKDILFTLSDNVSSHLSSIILLIDSFNWENPSSSSSISCVNTNIIDNFFPSYVFLNFTNISPSALSNLVPLKQYNRQWINSSGSLFSHFILISLKVSLKSLSISKSLDISIPLVSYILIKLYYPIKKNYLI